jgi:hypothetical protein
MKSMVTAAMIVDAGFTLGKCKTGFALLETYYSTHSI